jgi:hypothetical protein
MRDVGRSPTLLNYLLCLGFALGSGGCEEAVRELMASAMVEPLPAPSLLAPNDTQVKAFVSALDAAARQGDRRAITQLVDWQTMVRRSLQGLRASDALLPRLEERASEAARERGLAAQLATVAEGKAGLRYLGTEQRAGATWQTFRLTPEAGGFDHMSFLLALDSLGSPRIVDIYTMSAGEPSSAVLRRMLLPVLASDARSVLARLSGKDAAFTEHVQTLIEIQKAAAQQRAREAFALFDRLPASLRAERWLMIQRVAVARQLDDATYLSAIEALHRAHPDDPATGVHLIDGYLLAQRHDAALEAVTAVEKGSIADPFFDVTRANILLAAQKLPEARAAAERAILAEPTLLDAHWAKVAATLRQRDFSATTGALLDMHERFALSYALDGVPDYADYVASEEYARLLASLALAN